MHALQLTGSTVWEDSVEIASNLYWTPNLAETFKKMHGYDIGKYAMLLSYNNGLGFSSSYPQRFYTDEMDQGRGYVDDYRATMTSLLMEYYKHLVEWSNQYLGMEFSGQMGYNLPVDMASSFWCQRYVRVYMLSRFKLEVVPSVSVPEDESLSFHDRIGRLIVL